MILTLFFTLIISFLFYKYYKRYQYMKHFKDIPGPKPWPIIGNIDLFHAEGIDLCEGGVKAFEKVWRQYGSRGIFKFQLGLEPKIILCKASTIAMVTNSKVL